MSAYYNEIDPQCADWLRNLIKAGHIADGEVDNRSILDVSPTDLKGFSQCHFFAGIGVWSRALRLAGWCDDQRVWTGSCPCQPFSAAGVRGGFADERHLWPAFFHLIEQCAPPTVFGEQVASKDGLNWIDLVHADMEGAGYTFGATDLCAAGVGAPHIRQRLWFVGCRLADAELHGYLTGTVARSLSARESQGRLLQLEGRRPVERVADSRNEGSQGRLSGRQNARRESIDGYAGRGSAIERLGDSYGGRRLEREKGTGSLRETSSRRQTTELARHCTTDDFANLIGLANPNYDEHEPQRRGDGNENGEAPSDGQNVAIAGQLGGTSNALCRLADADEEQRRRRTDSERLLPDGAQVGRQQSNGIAQSNSAIDKGQSATGPTNGFWRDADWLFCRDGKWRPVEPQSFPLVNGAPSRVVRLRAYGNAINAEVAATFIEAACDGLLGLDLI